MTRNHLIRRQLLGAKSPWSFSVRVRILLWQAGWLLLCRWTPKLANTWRLVVLRSFGARVFGHPFVHQRARIAMPWNLELHDRSCVGDRANLYSQDRITLRTRALVAQESYLCCGTHDLADPEWPLLTAPIDIGEGAFIGARAFVLPGISIGAQAVVGAMSVVTRDVPARTTVAGNPARSIAGGTSDPR